MNFKHALRPFKPVFQNFLLVIFAGIFPLAAHGAQNQEIGEKQIEVAMRMIGHEVLLCLGDDESRILPIEQIDDHYKIPFAAELGFNPDDIVSVIEQVMAQTGVATQYLVEVEQCETQEVVHSFLVGFYGMIPCSGRLLPEACYSLLITILDGIVPDANVVAAATENPAIDPDIPADSSSLTATEAQTSHPIRSAFLIIPLVILIGFAAYFIRKKDPAGTNPNLIRIGAFQFDKRNMALSFGDKTVELSHKEAELLSLLHTAANEPLEREVILHKVWGDEGDYVGRTLDVFISKLRKKLEADASVKIVNIRGVGYKLVVDGPE